MNEWEKDFAVIKMIVSAIYGAMIIYAMMILLRIPAIPYRWEQAQQIIFFVLLASVPGMFFISALIGKQMMYSEKLAEKLRANDNGENGMKAATESIRTGAMIMAAVGEACAMYGLLLYFLSGDSTRPWIFLALGAIHYTLTMARLGKAREDLQHLSRGY
jgi:hypothetical protein